MTAGYLKEAANRCGIDTDAIDNRGKVYRPAPYDTLPDAPPRPRVTGKRIVWVCATVTAAYFVAVGLVLVTL